ncbi:MAG: hypothetical protein JWO30_4834 [Fibrobacteres bacterium]|nr:hypothetical protein [Fibrobacterota bacterium]
MRVLISRSAIAPATRTALIGLLVAGGIGIGTAAESGNSLELKHEFFWDRNGVWNHTPAFILRTALSRVWSFSWEQELDLVSGASRRLGADKVGQFGDRELDAVSGASKVEIRHSENPSLTYSHQGTVAAGSLYYSHENDYTSVAPSGSIAFDFNDRNTTLGANYAEFFDDFRPTGAFRGQGGKKRITSMGGTLAQSLTSLTLVGITATFVNSRGYLGHPYNPPMDASGMMLLEAVPATKKAGALSGQIVQGYRLGDLLGSINVDYRKYQDDWGIKSGTADAKISQYFAESAYIRLRARYYTQTGALFAKEVYQGTETYRTGDIRFFPFSSLLVGAKISTAFPASWGESAFLPDRWDLKFDYTVRDTRGDKQETAAGEPRSLRYQLYGADEYYRQGVVMGGLTFNL